MDPSRYDDLDSLPADVSELLEKSENTVHRFDPAITRGPARLSQERRAVAGSVRFRAGDVLGTGGMAVVHSADQISLRRTVALKALPNTHRGPPDVAMLVREAQTTAKLEHPNIVPVYDLDHDEDGVPFMVMKQVVGEPWRAVMHDDKPRAGDESRTRFEWNLDVLDSVCDALRFAHSQGVLHRDVKPDNVMVGEYGEVYVVDWGIAVSATPESDPLKFEVSSTWVGSPAYMAPEMVERGAVLSVRTDVYQLGGMLFEMLVGRPPHAHRGRLAIAKSILASPPTVPPGVDEDLVAIIRRAMALRPSERFASVGEFQRALREHRSHRVSHRLVSAADPHAFEASMERGDEPGARDCYDELAGTLGLALEEWPENPRAIEMLDAATERFARFLLEHGSPERAQELLRSMRHPSEELEAGCVEAIERRRAHVRAGQESDLLHGLRGRAFMLTIGGIAAVMLGVVQFLRGAVPTFTELVGTDIFTFVLIAAFSTRRDWIAEVRLHRNAAMFLVVVCLCRLAMIYGHETLGLDATHVFSVSFLLWAVLAAGLAAMTDWRMLLASGVYLSGFVLALDWPEWIYPLMCVGHFAMFSTIAFSFGLRGGRPIREQDPKQEATG